MIKKQLWLFLPILILIITGCAHEEAAHLEPLDPAKWPTAAVAAAPPSPTPFPRATLRVESTIGVAAVETPTPIAEPVESAAAAGTPIAAAGSGSLDLTAAMVSNVLSQFSIMATGITTTPDLAIRQGPGTNYGSITSIESGSIFGILGKNSGGDWVYVVDATLSPGWLPVSGLRVVGSLDGAPVLPANPIAALIQSAAAAPSTESASAQTAPAASSEPVLSANLTPVTTAKVNNDGLNMRQGPGASYARIVTLANNDEVNILALNPRKDWALVETASNQRGWVSLAYLAVAGPIATAPVVPAAELSQAGVAVTDAVQPAAMVVPTESVSNPAPAIGNLGPVATAKTVRDPVEIRPGPDTDYAPIDELRLSDEVIPLLAVDQTGQWVLVNPTSATVGWVALNDLKIEGSLANAPRINTAWVKSNAVEVRSGPGIFNDAVGVLAIQSLIQVLGLDESRSWVMVKPIPAGEVAWAPINFLVPGGRWADMPTVKDEGGRMKAEAEQQVSHSQPFIPANPEPHIVFQRSSGGDIMVINPDGSGLRRLTSGIDPVLSPDGQMVAFTRWEGETGSIWVINLDGSSERQIQGFVKQAKGPDWSPDGSQLVFNFQDGGRTEPKTECFPVGEGKNPPRPPRNATDFKVSFGSGGAKVCWKLPPDPHWGLRVVNLTDDKFKDVDGGTYAFRPAWDPGQSWRIVSDGGRGLLEVDVNRDYRQAITEELNDGSPVFSPDGRYLAVTLGQQGGGSGWNIFRLNANGTGRIQLTETPLWETAQPGNDQAWNNVAPAWSPDASQIAFLTDRTDGWEIWVMNADGSNQRPLFSAEVNEQLQITYDFVDERVLSWR